jgi:hypothetical protein
MITLPRLSAHGRVRLAATLLERGDCRLRVAWTLVPKFLAAVAVGSQTGLCHMLGHPVVQMAPRNRVFEALGLRRLHVAR